MQRVLHLFTTAIFFASAPPLFAQTVVYSNYAAGFTGQGLTYGAGGLASQGSVTYTAMHVDNIVLAPSAANQTITSLNFTLFNRTSPTVTLRAHLRFYADDNGGMLQAPI